MFVKSFVHLKESWYANTILSLKTERIDDIYFIIEQDNKVAEFVIEWVRLGNDEVPQFKSFDDTWWAFSYILEILLWLSHHEKLTPQELCAYLLSVGYVDRTIRYES